MILELVRKYHPSAGSGTSSEDSGTPSGTNGRIQVGQWIICHTIELPWRDNQRNISCIPEGCYELVERTTKTRGRHLMLKHVEGRSYILLHVANDAEKELKGCIAPVSLLTGPGKGEQSRRALELLEFTVFNAFEMGEKVKLMITS